MATKFFLTNDQSEINAIGFIEKVAQATIPSSGGLQTIATATAAGPTAGVQINGGGNSWYWLSPPLQALTISGTITLNLWMSESGATANVGPDVKIERTDLSGVVISQIARSEFGTELPTPTRAAQNWTVAATTTTLAHKDRIKITIFGNDAGGNMAASATFDLGYNGATGAADGDSYVQFAETVIPILPTLLNNYQFVSVGDGMSTSEKIR